MRCRRKRQFPPKALRTAALSPRKQVGGYCGLPLQHPPTTVSGLPLPKQLQGHGQDFPAIERKDGFAIIEDDAGLEIATGLGGQAAQSISVRGMQRGGSFHLNAPDLAAAGDDHIHLDQVLVPVVPRK